MILQKSDITELARLAVEGAAALTPHAAGTPKDSHGNEPEASAVSIARGLHALIEAGRLAEQIREAAR